MKLTRVELRQMMDEAGKQYVQLPAATRFAGDEKVLSENERLNACILMSVARVLAKKGFINLTCIDELDPEFEVVDSETATEGF
jgi:hypothetical protein